MDFQLFSWIAGAIVASLTIYNTVIGWGRRTGMSDQQQAFAAENEKAVNRRFDLFDSAFQLHKASVDERFAKVMESLNKALIEMARNHPTKADLLESERRIIDRVDLVTLGKTKKPD